MPWARPGGATTASYRNLGGSGAAAEGVKGVSRAAGGRQKEAERAEPRWHCTSRRAGCALEAPGVGVRQPVRANDGAALGKGCLNRGVVDRKRKVRHVDAHLLVPSRRRCRGLLLLLLLLLFLGFLRRDLLCCRRLLPALLYCNKNYHHFRSSSQMSFQYFSIVKKKYIFF